MNKVFKKIFTFTLIAAISTNMVACGNATTSTPAEIDFSKESITCIVPYDAGGGTDTVMRALADAAKGSFKNITVENRAGGGGATGMLVGAHSDPDGTTITMTTVELITLEAMGINAGLTYTMFKPLMMVNTAAAAITVKADDDRFHSLEDFITYSKSDQLQIGNSGNGAIWHLAAAGLAKETGADFKHIAYDGAAGAITDLLGEHIDAVAVSYAEVANYVESGDFKVLGVLADNRIDAIPDVPTAKEQGYDSVLGTWRGLSVPADTPDEVVAELYEIFMDAAQSQEFIEFMNNSNNIIETMDGASYAERMKNDLTIYTELVNDLGLKIQ
ncbi:tripartite tricarboxylate transporter substrate binding protein [Candidatus Epulonipiscium viviparus]|uniref:tripartite tricarboxylate transporter substrate binding protein n=1 Tax=Candidatus Epulonipiscium viviparus TaxID=420336 RepID=UPI002738060B|nr:tripartite tricarboxylate transporter substrate binding protein [Candidatus Epulopiscium viviparus]